MDHDGVGLDKSLIVGLPDAAVRESLERVKAAISNGGYSYPKGSTLINLAPADLRKEGRCTTSRSRWGCSLRGSSPRWRVGA